MGGLRKAGKVRSMFGVFPLAMKGEFLAVPNQDSDGVLLARTMGCADSSEQIFFLAGFCGSPSFQIGPHRLSQVICVYYGVCVVAAICVRHLSLARLVERDSLACVGDGICRCGRGETHSYAIDSERGRI